MWGAYWRGCFRQVRYRVERQRARAREAMAEVSGKTRAMTAAAWPQARAADDAA